MLFAITSIDKANALDLRMATREQHLSYGAKVGNLRLGGPFMDEAGNMVGSFVVLEADSLEAAQAWAHNDPYYLAGLFSSVDVRPWKMTINKCGAQF